MGPVEQVKPEIVFKPSNGPTDCGRGHAEGMGGFGKALLPRGSFKGAKGSEIGQHSEPLQNVTQNRNMIV